MKQLGLFTLLFLVPLAVTQGQEPPEQYPGQRNHAHPPEDWYCEHDSQWPEHDCQCLRVARDAYCEDEPVASSCAAYCFEKAHFIPDPEGRHTNPSTGQRGNWFESHCHCPIVCSPGDKAKIHTPATPEHSLLSQPIFPEVQKIFEAIGPDAAVTVPTLHQESHSGRH